MIIPQKIETEIINNGFSVEHFKTVSKYILKENPKEFENIEQAALWFFASTAIYMIQAKKEKFKKVRMKIQDEEGRIYNFTSLEHLVFLYHKASIDTKYITIFLTGNPNIEFPGVDRVSEITDPFHILMMNVYGQEYLEANRVIMAIFGERKKITIDGVSGVGIKNIQEDIDKLGLSMQGYKKAASILINKPIEEEKKLSLVGSYWKPLFEALKDPLGTKDAESEMATSVLKQGNLKNLTFLLFNYFILWGDENKVKKNNSLKNVLDKEIMALNALFDIEDIEDSNSFEKIVKIISSRIPQDQFVQAGDELIHAIGYYKKEQQT